MRVLDYALEGKKDAVSYDECGNLYLDRSKSGYFDFEDMGIPCVNLGDGVLFISKEDCEKYNQYEIINEDSAEYDTIARRPYYRMRGKPITEEQAFDIIRRTDGFFHGISKIVNHDDFVGDMNFRNFLIEKNHYPTGYGWNCWY